MSAASLLKRAGPRSAVAAVAFGVVAVSAQHPASRLEAESRLGSSLFTGETDAQRIFLERQRTSLFLPQKRSLHYFWLGNDSLAACSVWIRSADYVAREFSYRFRGRKFQWLSKLYGTVVDLDPHWQGATRLGATLLAAVGEDPDGALELLEKGMAANPDSWRLPYEAGLLCLLAPGRSADAARYFRMAALRPGCPEVIDQVIPRLTAEAGRLDLAIRHARDLADRFRGQAMGASMAATLRELVSRQEERLLGEAVELFRERTGRLPADLAEARRAGALEGFDLAWAEASFVAAEGHARLRALCRERSPGDRAETDVARIVASGFLNAAVLEGAFPAPEAADAWGSPFRHHAPSGTVRSEGIARIDVARTLAVLRRASVKFRSANGRFASSLDELARFFADWTRSGKSLQQEWHALFRDGRAPVHPLAAWGEGYTYDPETGVPGASWTE